MRSAFERSIRRQQYRWRPSSSRTLSGCWPPFTREINGSHREPTTLPQVKHRTGMIIVHRYDFCRFFRAPRPSGFFGSFRRVSGTMSVRS